MAMLIPISRLPKFEKIVIGTTIEIVRTIALEKSVLLKNFIKSFWYFLNGMVKSTKF
ncbi:hypothetical protein GFO_1529 [Christiangramia forsetii KT0803]|uniref:Uncharacterized protein n=1 Tax=Christiangramia forsetii (strain DSM 17595 / CGMCC 1.15422 / KT0803) TaxID=411154 RepID=A0M1K6_CHRFK|nr:hypothetical protein GFO_1529 [Christiangramia forsetii KT0803]